MSNVSYDPQWRLFRDLKVFAFRIMVHSLGAHFVGHNSENHVTINCLIGSGRTVRMDMKVGRGEQLEGVLDISLRPFTVSESAILSLDLRAQGCPPNFDPSRETKQNESACSVRDVVSELLQRNLQNFRFVYIGEVTDGCRFWVYVRRKLYEVPMPYNDWLTADRWTAMSTLADANYLERQDALVTPPDRLPGTHRASTSSLWATLHHKWDTQRDAQLWPLVPGLWIMPQRISQQGLFRELLSAGKDALEVLGSAVEGSRSEENGRLIRTAASTYPDQQSLSVIERALHEVVLSRDREAVIDMFQLPTTWQALHDGLRGRFGLATNAITLASGLPEQVANRRGIILALLLSAVIDMSGPPDAS